MINEKYSRWIVSLLIFGFGMFFLGLVVYYIAFFPVPVPIKPLKSRIVTWLHIDDVTIQSEAVEDEDSSEGVEEIIKED